MNTREELDEIDRVEADIAARLRLRGGLDEGPPTCPPLTAAEAAAEDEALGLRPFPFEEWQEMVEAARTRGRAFVRRAEERCRGRGVTKRYCPWCGEKFTGEGWQHPDLMTESLFGESADAFWRDAGAGVEIKACSEQCWKWFMESSYDHWKEG